MPVQALLLRVSDRAARRFPHWYHRQVCRILGVRLNIEGEVAKDAPVLLVCNHTSWLDIPVLSALAPVSFVAKLEVGGWPFVSALARLQRSVFVDRTRRLAAGDAANEITKRLQQGDTIVLFAEGTSSDGNRVLPFKTSLFGAVAGAAMPSADQVVVQTAAVVYTHIHGVPVTRAERPRLGWYGDMEMTSHAWGVLKSGSITVTIKVSPPVPLAEFKDRKDLALKSERTVRRDVLAILRGRSDSDLVPVEPSEEARRAKLTVPVRKSEKWT
jgi:1-acyl-sn-glycerol-3-phosphate acyltransferase